MLQKTENKICNKQLKLQSILVSKGVDRNYTNDDSDIFNGLELKCVLFLISTCMTHVYFPQISHYNNSRMIQKCYLTNCSMIRHCLFAQLTYLSSLLSLHYVIKPIFTAVKMTILR